MNISQAISHIFPNAECPRDFMVQDDGEGQFIALWNIDVEKPTEEELLIAWKSYLNRPVELSEMEKLKGELATLQDALDFIIMNY